MTTKTTPSEQTGIKLIDPSEIDEIGWSEPDQILFRIWVKSNVVLSFFHNWKDLPIRYVLDEIQDKLGYRLRPQDSTIDYGEKFMIRDIYIKSSLLEKLYE